MLPCARQAGGNQIKSEAWPLATGNADPEQPIPLAEPPPPPICAASSASWATRELLSSLRVAPPACHDNHLARIAGTNGMRTQPSSACMHRPRARSMPTHPTTMAAMSDWMVGGGLLRAAHAAFAQGLRKPFILSPTMPPQESLHENACICACCSCLAAWREARGGTTPAPQLELRHRMGRGRRGLTQERWP